MIFNRYDLSTQTQILSVEVITVGKIMDILPNPNPNCYPYSSFWSESLAP